ncbi:unnamed protein product [Dovyalis caffra]|uniref:Uncharacterized protein n=1 Tax=Dovyalis caffra TaxID=77055 RepID=A0AAV1SKP5_9ROSI|nr:unnamed protein product [Dovyalis caffra]
MPSLKHCVPRVTKTKCATRVIQKRDWEIRNLKLKSVVIILIFEVDVRTHVIEKSFVASDKMIKSAILFNA